MSEESIHLTDNMYYTLGEIKANISGLGDYVKERFKTLEDKLDDSTIKHQALEKEIKDTNKRIDKLIIQSSVIIIVGGALWAVFGPTFQRILGL